MAIDPNNITTVRVGELPPAPINLSDKIIHEIGTELFQTDIHSLADFVKDYIGTVSSLAFNPTIVPDGGTLPITDATEWILVGKGTFHNVAGFPDITTTEELNALVSNGTSWSIGVEIPINVELAGITQTIRSGYLQTTPSENTLYNEFAKYLKIVDLPPPIDLSGKLDKVTTVTPNTQAYVKLPDGSQSMLDYPSDLNLKSYLSTGLIKNGLISINADPTKFNISSGIGVISNFDDPENPISNLVDFPAFTSVTPAYLTTGNITYIAINNVPAIVMQATPFTQIQRRDLILLGAVVHSNLTNINVVNNISAPTNAYTNQLHDFIEAVGALNITGNKYTPNGANLSLNKSAGTIFKLGVNFVNDWKNPHQLNQSSGTAFGFRYRTQNGTEGSDVTVINPNTYDVANVLTTVPNNKFTIQTVAMFQTGITRIQYGQSIYDSLAEAQSAIFTRSFNLETNIAENGIIRAYIIVKKNTTSLQSANEALIVEAQKFGGIASGGVALTLANIVTALGYTPENVANKATNFTTVNNTLYPTIQAVKTYLDAPVSTNVAYVDVNGDNATGILGSIKKSFSTIDAALDALPTTGGVVKIGVGTFLSPTLAKIKDNIKFIGSGKPYPNMTITYASQSVKPTISSPTKLIGGTILNGQFVITGKNNIEIHDLGVDVGKEWIDANGGTPVNGIAHGANLIGNEVDNNIVPPSKGLVVVNVASLNYNSTAPVHAAIFENVIDAKIDKVSTYYGTHGVVIKARGVNLSNVIAYGHYSNGVIIKANNYAYCSDVNVSDIYISSISPYDGGGFRLESESGGVLARINVNNLNVEHTIFGIEDSSGTDGLNINNVTISDVTGHGIYIAEFSKKVFLNNIVVDGVGLNGIQIVSYSLLNDKTLTNCTVRNASVTGAYFYAVGGIINLSNVNIIGGIFIDGGATSNVRGFNVKASTTFTGSLVFDASSSIEQIATIDTNGKINKSNVAISGIRPYKVYVATITQTSTSAPVATVLENTLGGTVVWTRTDIGMYTGTLSGVFTVNKTTIIAGSGAIGGGGTTYSLPAGPNEVKLLTRNPSFTTSDNLLATSMVEIRVYP